MNFCMVERQVRYNSSRSKRNPQWQEWYFLIINQNREIGQISTRIYELFAPIAEEYKGLEDTVRGWDLRFKLLHFETERKPDFSQFKRIFNKMIKDSSLYDRQNSDGLEKYIRRTLFS